MEPVSPKTKTPRLFGRGVEVLSTWVWWCYLHKPDSRAWLDGNKDEYEDGSDEAAQRRRHGGRGLEHLRGGVALRHVARKTRPKEACQQISLELFGLCARSHAWLHACHLGTGSIGIASCMDRVCQYV